MISEVISIIDLTHSVYLATKAMALHSNKYMKFPLGEQYETKMPKQQVAN